jgi:predicted nuclease of predicted toxin-antitoxin system
VRLKLDENLGHRWAEQLRAAGHDVETVHEENLSGATDDAVARSATLERRALVTLDVDFANLLRFPPRQTAGIAVLRVRIRPGRRDLDSVVNRLIEALDRADMAGQLWIVEPGRVRRYEEPTE